MKKIIFVVLILSAICGTFYFVKVIKNKLRQAPGGDVSLEFPLKGVGWKAAQSGQNGNIHALPVEKYALDIVKTPVLSDYLKFRKTGLDSDRTFGTPVYSPCTGNVATVVDGFPDMPIGIEGRADEANRATVDCGQFKVAMIHFKKGSILVKAGDSVKVGQQIGLIGNSGHSSGPHLHMMAYRPGPNPDDPKTPLPMTFNGKYLFRGDIFP